MEEQEDKSEHFGWLVRARSEVQLLSLRLYSFGKKNPKAIASDEPCRSVFLLLVGAAFSLWRAATLSDIRRDWNVMADNAMKLLDVVLEDNAVTYQTERKTNEWMGGYYLNNAMFRIIAMKRRVPALAAGTAVKKLDPLMIEDEFSGIQAVKPEPPKIWNALLAALKEMMDDLEERAEASP